MTPANYLKEAHSPEDWQGLDYARFRKVATRMDDAIARLAE